MTEFLVLLKIRPGKIVETMDSLRKIPSKPVDGVDLCYTMNIFGTWDVGVWFNAENTGQAVDFVHKKLKEVPGITDVYTLPTFPQQEAQIARLQPNSAPKKAEEIPAKKQTS